MKAVLRNIVAVAAGLVIGSFVNLGLVVAGPVVIPPPEGADLTTPEGLAKAMPLLGPEHFLFPFLAHAVGTCVGSLTAHLIAADRRDLYAWSVGFVFLAGGIMACFMIPAPRGFMAADLLFAYLPMAWLGAKTGRRLRKSL